MPQRTASPVPRASGWIGGDRVVAEQRAHLVGVGRRDDHQPRRAGLAGRLEHPAEDRPAARGDAAPSAASNASASPCRRPSRCRRAPAHRCPSPQHPEDLRLPGHGARRQPEGARMPVPTTFDKVAVIGNGAWPPAGPELDRLVAAFLLALGTGSTLDLLSGVSIAVTRQISGRRALHAAERLGAVYLPAALVGLAVALLANPRAAGASRAGDRRVRRGRRRHARAPALDPPGRERRVSCAGLTPDAVGPLAHAAGASPGSCSCSPRAASPGAAGARGRSRSPSPRSRRRSTSLTGFTRGRSSRPPS